MKKIAILTLLLTVFSVLKCIAISPSDIKGVYEFPEPDTGLMAMVKIYQFGKDSYNVRLVWSEDLYDEEGLIRLDVKNPDESLRNTPADKIVMVRDLKFNPQEERWESNYFYHPIWGKIFDVHIYMEDENTLKVRGFWEKPMFGKTVYWTRIDENNHNYINHIKNNEQ